MPVDWLPPAEFLLPDQPPDAVHVVAPVTVQISVALLPDTIDVGEEVSVTVGAGTTVMVVDALTFPPVPVQSSVNVVDVFNAFVTCEPDVDLVPDQPPDALHEVALVVLHVSVDVAPEAIAFGDALNVMVGAGMTVTVVEAAELPPAPVQLSV